MHSMWMHVLHHLLLGVPAVIAYALSAAALALTAAAVALAAAAHVHALARKLVRHFRV